MSYLIFQNNDHSENHLLEILLTLIRHSVRGAI